MRVLRSLRSCPPAGRVLVLLALALVVFATHLVHLPAALGLRTTMHPAAAAMADVPAGERGTADPDGPPTHAGGEVCKVEACRGADAGLLAAALLVAAFALATLAPSAPAGWIARWQGPAPPPPARRRAILQVFLN